MRGKKKTCVRGNCGNDSLRGKSKDAQRKKEPHLERKALDRGAGGKGGVLCEEEKRGWIRGRNCSPGKLSAFSESEGGGIGAAGRG